MYRFKRSAERYKAGNLAENRRFFDKYVMSFSIFEALMLICFGVSWPVSIYRSIKSRTAKGKSLLFLILLALAYTAGILHKALVRFDIVILLYSANFIMIAIDIALYIRNARLDARRESE